MVWCEYVKYGTMILTMVAILNFQVQIALKIVKPFCTKKIKTKISQSAILIIWSTFQSSAFSDIFRQSV